MRKALSLINVAQLLDILDTGLASVNCAHTHIVTRQYSGRPMSHELISKKLA